MWTHERTEAASSSPADPRNSMCKKSVMLCGFYVVLTNGHSHAILEYILHDAMTSRIPHRVRYSSATHTYLVRGAVRYRVRTAI